MLWNQVKEKIMWREEMRFEDIMKRKDIKAGLDYLHHRASTIRQMQIIEMIKGELKERERE